ncbi:MAG: DUF1616 domain-containing protein, partial [Methanosarcinaceae archaeon]
MPNFKKCIFVEDLLAVTIFSCLGVLFVLIPPFNETFLRIPIALSLFFFIPGYAFIAALFPGNEEISGIERFTLSVGFSLVLTVFDGFFISLLPWGYRPAPIVVSILGMTVFFSIIAIFTRKLRDEDKQFSFSIKEFIEQIRSEDIGEYDESSEETSVPAESRRFHRSKSKVKAKGLKAQSTDTKSNSNSKSNSKSNSTSNSNLKATNKTREMPLPPEIEKALVIALIGSIIIASGMLVYAKMTREKETFTALYLLGPEGKAEGYPSESFIDIPLTVTVGIDNHELQEVNYILQMKVDGQLIEELNVPVEDGGTWQENLTYTRQKLKNDRSKLEFALFKEEVGYFPYRSVHLYLQNNNSLTHLGDKYGDVARLPVIVNGEMESFAGWNFVSSTEFINGSYVNSSGVDSSFAYRIVNSYSGNFSEFTQHSGSLSQSIDCQENTMAVVSVFVKDNFSSKSDEVGNTQFKQIVLDNEVLWEDGISGDEGWQHIEVPVSLKEGTNILTLRLMQIGNSELVPVEVLWDSVSLKSVEELSPYTEGEYLVESIPPVSKVLELQPYTNNETFKVEWNGTDEGSGIAGYNISYSVDGASWESWISKTTVNSAIFTGKPDKTYYFRSKAVDRAGNWEEEHTEPDTKTAVYSGLPEITLDITPNPCKDGAWFTVTSSAPLKEQFCLVTIENWDPEFVEMASSDSLVWRGRYVVDHGDILYVEAVCMDMFSNSVSVFDELLVDNSLSDFEIEISPKTIDKGELEIRVTPSTALKSKPYVSISANEDIDVVYLTYSEDGEYIYTAKIK